MPPDTPSSQAPGNEAPRKAEVISDDLPVTMLVALATAVITSSLGVVRELVFVSVVLAALAAAVIKNYLVSKDWDRRKVLGLTAVLTLLAELGSLLARLLRRPAGEPAAACATEPARSAAVIVTTSAVAAGATICVVIVVAAVRGEPVFPDRESTTSAIAVAEPTPGLDCGAVDAHANSDVGTFGIVASGVGCDSAREVARLAPDAFPGSDRPFDVAGFTCTGVTREDGLRRTEFTCRRPDAQVRFSRS